MIAVIIGFISGIVCFVIGRVVTLYLIKDKFLIGGTLNVTPKVDQDGPYLSVGLDIPIEEISKHKYVTMAINNIDPNPHK